MIRKRNRPADLVAQTLRIAREAVGEPEGAASRAAVTRRPHGELVIYYRIARRKCVGLGHLVRREGIEPPTR